MKNLIRTLLMREENIDYDNPFWLTKWIDIKVKLLTHLDTIEELKKYLKEE